MFTILLYVVSGYSALTLLLFALSIVIPPLSFPARVLASYGIMLACAMFGILSSIVLRLTQNQGIAQWLTGRAFALSMASLLGVRFDVRDPTGTLGRVRPAVFIGNHQTELDLAMLGSMFPKYCSVTAKSSLRNMPVLGWFMSLSGTVFIDRRNSQDARQAMRGAAGAMRSRSQSVYMFPEGTRSHAKDPILLPFKKGAFYLAVEAGVPIVPCVVANYSHVLSVKNYVFRSGTIPVKVLAPIPTTGLTAADVDDLVKRTYDVMLKELVTLTAEVQPDSLTFSDVKSKKIPVVVKASGVDTSL